MENNVQQANEIPPELLTNDAAGEINRLRRRLAIIEKYQLECWEMIGEILDYIKEFSTEHSNQNNQLLKAMLETKLAQRYNTQSLRSHQQNNAIHYLSKEEPVKQFGGDISV